MGYRTFPFASFSGWPGVSAYGASCASISGSLIVRNPFASAVSRTSSPLTLVDSVSFGAYLYRATLEASPLRKGDGLFGRERDDHPTHRALHAPAQARDPGQPVGLPEPHVGLHAEPGLDLLGQVEPRPVGGIVVGHARRLGRGVLPDGAPVTGRDVVRPHLPRRERRDLDGVWFG